MVYDEMIIVQMNEILINTPVSWFSVTHTTSLIGFSSQVQVLVYVALIPVQNRAAVL